MTTEQMDWLDSQTPKAKAAKRRKDTRTTTAIRFPVAVHEALAKAAADRDLSMNYLVVRAVEDFLPRLIPADELTLTRPGRSD
jgi:predicted HicB family RNase H-like nuclease